MGFPRVIVTGARDWTNKLMVISALNDVYSHYGKFCLVKGDCPTGVDDITDKWWLAHGRNSYVISCETFEARWDIEGLAAGPHRNRRMVSAGAKVALAFPLGDSPGTRDCMSKLKVAGIPTRIYDFKSGMYRVQQGVPQSE